MPVLLLELGIKTSCSAPLKGPHFFPGDPGPSESCINSDCEVSQAELHMWDQTLRHLLGTAACFHQRKAGCYFLPKTVKRLFPLQLFVYLRNLRG